jgi:hypothetical protein
MTEKDLIKQSFEENLTSKEAVKNRAMLAGSKKKRLSKKAIFILATCCVLIITVFSGALYMFPGLFKSVGKPNLALARLVGTRAKNAQYMPEAQTLSLLSPFGALSQGLMSSGGAGNYNSVAATKIDKNGFIEVLDALGQIEPTQQGKWDGYDIYEIKKEVLFVLESAPYFNQWFKLPVMRPGGLGLPSHGFLEFPYYTGYSYFVESNEDATDVTITSVSTHSGNRYIDFDKNQIIMGSYETLGLLGSGPVSHQTMQIRYYFDEENREVVECFVYSVLVDNVNYIRDFNGNESDYYSLNFQYLKNVKDTSLTRYNIQVAEKYRRKDLPFASEWDGYDLRGLSPYGVSREFIQLDYTDANDIQLLRMSQIVPTDIYNRPATTSIAFYNLKDGVQFLSHTYDYCMPADFNKVSLPSRNSHVADTAKFFIEYEKLNTWWSKIDGDISHADMPARASTYAATNGNEQSLMRALQTTVVNLATNLGVDGDAVLAFNEEFEPRNTVSSFNFRAEKALDNLLFSTAKTVIDGCVLKNNFAEIYRGAKLAPTIGQIYGPFYKMDIPIQYINGNVFYQNGNFTGSNIVMSFIDKAYYDCRMAVALKSENGEEYYILYSSNTAYDNPSHPYWRHGNDWHEFPINIPNEGVYTAVLVLTRIIDGIEVVVFDTLMPAKISGFRGLNIPDTFNDDGSVSTYSADGRGKELKITVSLR